MRRARKKPSEDKSRKSVKIELRYEVYGDDFFEDPKVQEEILFEAIDPFQSSVIAYTKYAPCWVVELVGEKTKEGFRSFIEQAFHIRGDAMKVLHESSDYYTVIIYADSSTEFFQKIKEHSLARKFNLWEITYNKRVATVADFTQIYDSTMILSMFGNRLKLRLDGVEEVTGKRKKIAVHSAHYAIIFEEDKSKFL